MGTNCSEAFYYHYHLTLFFFLSGTSLVKLSLGSMSSSLRKCFVSSVMMALVSCLLSLTNNSRMQFPSCKYLLIQKSNRDYRLLINSCVIRTLQDFLLIGLLRSIQYGLSMERRLPEQSLGLFLTLPTSRPHLQSCSFIFPDMFFKKHQQNTVCLDLCL